MLRNATLATIPLLALALLPACASSGEAGKGRTATNAYLNLANEPVGTGGCVVGGCSGQICSDQDGVVTTCEWREEYACYQDATCERQPDGACGWTMDGTLQACLGTP